MIDHGFQLGIHQSYSKMKLTEKYTFKILYILEQNFEPDSSNIVLPMGTYFSSVDQLIELTINYTKNKHLLIVTDLKPEDKINFQSAQKMCSTKVLEILSQLPDTNATVAYLSVMNYILASFLDKELNVEERIYKIWFIVFFLRIWRAW